MKYLWCCELPPLEEVTSLLWLYPEVTYHLLDEVCRISIFFQTAQNSWSSPNMLYTSAVSIQFVPKIPELNIWKINIFCIFFMILGRRV